MLQMFGVLIMIVLLMILIKLEVQQVLAIDLLTPVGPLSFSLTQPITKKSTDKTETFRFNLEQLFNDKKFLNYFFFFFFFLF